MTDVGREASEWRIGLAREAAAVYSPARGVAMIVLGGSPSRGLSDRWSDLDIVVYWDEFDRAFVESAPLRRPGLERSFFAVTSEDGTCIESYRLEGLKIDFGHAPMSAWARWVADLTERHDPAPWLQKTVAGFLDSVPLHNPALVSEWKARVATYPEPLALKIVKSSLGFFQRGVLDHQGRDRGDVLFFYDGICATMKKLLTILAAVNRVYFSAEEPRWIEHELGRMAHKPPRLWERMREALEGDPAKAARIVEDLVPEVLDLVSAHVQGADVSRLRRIYEKPLTPCDSRPALPPDPKTGPACGASLDSAAEPG